MINHHYTSFLIHYFENIFIFYLKDSFLLYYIDLKLRLRQSMNKYSKTLNTLNDISNFCKSSLKKQSDPLKNIYLCIRDISDGLTQYIYGQSSKNFSSQLKITRGEVDKEYIDIQINDVKTIIEKKILGLNIYENKIQKINEDIRKQFQSKAKQFKLVTQKFQQTLQRKIQKIYSDTQQSLYDYDKRITYGCNNRLDQASKKIQGKLLAVQNNLSDDIQKLYKKIVQLQKIKTNVSSPQKDREQALAQFQQMKNGGNIRRNQQLKPLNKRQQEDSRVRDMRSQPKKMVEDYGFKSAIGRNFGQNLKQPLKRDIQVKRDWIDQAAAGYNKLKVDRNIIIAKQPTDVYCKKVIRGSYTFYVSVIERGFAVGIGIIDSRKRMFSLEKVKFKMVFFADGDFWNGEQKNAKSGKGFKQQQCVTVSVNTAFGLIQWKVGDQLRLRQRSENLSSPQISWVPYVFLGAKQSTVGIAEQ